MKLVDCLGSEAGAGSLSGHQCNTNVSEWVGLGWAGLSSNSSGLRVLGVAVVKGLGVGVIACKASSWLVGGWMGGRVGVPLHCRWGGMCRAFASVERGLKV